MRFADRVQAGQLLAGKLERFRSAQPVVIGLTHGGVPVAAEVARLLGADLDFLVVRKLGAPGSPEYALGAVAEGGAVYLSAEALLEVGAHDEWVAEIADHAAAEIERRVRALRGGRAPRELTGRTVLVVDDGVATGATARAGARAARQRGAARVVLATPVVAAAAEPELRRDFDELVSVEAPDVFFAVGEWYDRFEQVTDDDVRDVLHRARAADGASEVERTAVPRAS